MGRLAAVDAPKAWPGSFVGLKLAADIQRQSSRVGPQRLANRDARRFAGIVTALDRAALVAYRQAYGR